VSIADKPQMRNYLVNTLISNANKTTSTSVIFQINKVLESQKADPVTENDIIVQLLNYANNGGSLKFGNISITPNSNFEIHP